MILKKEKASVDLHLKEFKFKKYISVVKHLKLDGFDFYPGGFLIFNLNVNIESSVGFIKTILNVDEQYYFQLQAYKIKSKINKLNCLEISPTDTFFYLNYEDLVYKQINFTNTFQSKLLLQVRYFHHLII